MKIAIDGSKAINEKAGVGRYTEAIIKNLATYYVDDELYLYFNFMRGGSSKKEAIDKLIGKHKNIHHKIYRLPGTIKEKLFYSNYSISRYWIGKCDIAHATDVIGYDNKLPIPQILTVHDLTARIFPEHQGKISHWIDKAQKKACINASAILSISEATKQDIIKYYKIPEDKIEVIYSGVDPYYKVLPNKEKLRSQLEKKYHFSSPFFLFVGLINPRKNVANLLRAFDLFSDSSDGSHQMIIAGKWGWNCEEVKKVYDDMKHKDKVVFLDYVPGDDLLYLYNTTDLFCYPSIYEGFGLPVLEAMACGAPVMTSNVSSLPEVGGDAAIYIDPTDFKDISKAMIKFAKDRSIAKKMSTLGLAQVKKFSWEKTIKNTHKLYEKVLHEQRY